jgi:hemolysin activation/secretion protein
MEWLTKRLRYIPCLALSRQSYSPILFILFTATIISLAPRHAVAQTNAPQSLEPGIIQERIRKPSTTDSIAPSAKPTAIPSIEQKIDGIDHTFILSGVEITGASVYPAAAFTHLYEGMLAQEVSTKTIEQLIKAIAAKYRDDGYFLANASADSQELAFGILNIKITEGVINKVTFQGDTAGRTGQLKRFADKIKSQPPARLARVERYLQLIDDLPGVAADSGIQPIDEDAGTYELIITVEHSATDGYASLDNRGTRSIGRYQALLNGNFNTALIGGGRTGLTLFTIPAAPRELGYAELSHSQTIGTEGLNVTVSGSHSRIKAGGAFDDRDLKSRSTRAALSINYPLIRSREQNLSISGSFDASNSRQHIDGERDFEDRVRTLRAGISFDSTDDWGGQNFLSTQVSKGLEILDASERGVDTPSRTGGNVEFAKLTASLSRRQKITERWAVQASLAGQISDQRLLSAEQFYLGGSGYGRAYDSGEIGGDDGAAAALELQFGEFLSLPYLDSYQFYGFYDFGVVWETPTTDYNGSTSLSSAGGGVRLGITKSSFAGIEVAKPLTRTVSNEGDKGPRVFFYMLAGY